jgi:low affinity Fe/Cu permease
MATDEHGPIHRIGCKVSGAVAALTADPLAQVGFILLCVAWFAFGLNVNVLTAALSILAITLTQMVLNSQGERERDAHRRDVALHAKLDELLLSSRRARDELAGIEELEEEEIEALKNGRRPADAGPFVPSSVVAAAAGGPFGSNGAARRPEAVSETPVPKRRARARAS